MPQRISTSDIYSRLPVWAQNVACSLKGIQMRRERYSRAFWKQLSFLQESQWWPLERQLEYQNARLSELVHHAYNNVPFYREAFTNAGVKPDDIRNTDDLKQLPILTKEMVRERSADLIARNHPKSRIRFNNTGGTTGTALRVAKDIDTPAIFKAFAWRHKERFGLKINDPFIAFAGRGAVPLNKMDPPFWRRNITLHQTYVSVHHMTKQNMPALAEYLQRRKVKYYTGYPSALNILANYLLDNRIELPHPPSVVVCASETVLPEYREAIRNAFRCDVTDFYGSTEVCSSASECEEHRYHLDTELGITELVPISDDHNGLCKIICTGLLNPVMPLIRYDIGDLATPSNSPCPCGRQSPTLLSIDGRTDGCITTPDGRRIAHLTGLFWNRTFIKECQVVQDASDHITLRLVIEASFTQKQERALVNDVRKYVGDSMRIDTVQLDHIPKSKNGKFRHIVNQCC